MLMLSLYLSMNHVLSIPTVITTDNSCGIYQTNVTICDPKGPGPCCSNSVSMNSGWCGSSLAYCAASNCILNCTTTYSLPQITSYTKTFTSITPVATSLSVITTDNSCGYFGSVTVICGQSSPGYCCSNVNGRTGWCGSTIDYCAPANCLFNCSLSVSTTVMALTTTISSLTATVTSTPKISVDGTCGNNVVCPNGGCCSSSGWCGYDEIHCLVSLGCQSQCNFIKSHQVYYSCNTKNHLSLTYDDGPSVYTNDVAIYLNSLGIKATFFMVGQNIMNYQSVVKNVYNLGHTIGIHTYTHPHLTTLDNTTILNELVKTINIITQLTGEIPKYFRPPYSDYNDIVLELAYSVGLNTVLFNLDSGDWQNYNLNYTEPIVLNRLNVLNSVSGVIDIMHDIHETILDLSKYTVNNSRSYQIVDMQTCLGF